MRRLLPLAVLAILVFAFTAPLLAQNTDPGDPPPIVGDPSPSCTVSAPSGATTNPSITFSIAFSESVTGLTASVITVTNGTKGAFTGSGANYTLTVTASAEGAVTCRVPAGAATGVSSGKTNNQSNLATVNYDITPPTCAVTGPTSPTRTSPINFTITFSESVTGLTAGSINVSGGSKGTLSGSGTTYTMPVTPSGQGDVTCQVTVNAAKDAAGNYNTVASNILSITYDTVAPTCAVTGPPTHNHTGAITFTATFSEPVTGLASGDFNVSGGSKGTLSGSGAVYTLPVTPSGTSSVTCRVNASAAQDAAGNSNTQSNTATATYDNTAPTVTSISAPSVGTTNTGPVSYTVNFSEGVQGFDSAADVQLNTTGTAAGSVGISGSGSGPYTVTLSSITGNGTLGITVKAGACTDYATNANSASSASTAFAVDNTAPTVTSISAPSASLTRGGPVTYTVTFSEAVSGLTGSGIQLNATGTATGTAAVTGTGPYTVTISSITGDGTLGITVKASACTDAAGNANTASSASTTFTVDNTAPTVTSISAPSATITKGGPITYTVNFSESVTGLASSGIQVNASGASAGSVGVSGSGSGPYTVTLSSITGDGTLGITVKAGSCADTAGNGSTASSASGTFTVDNTAPTVTSISAPSASATRGGPITYTVNFSEPVSGLAASGIQINATGGAAGTVGVSGTGSGPYTVTMSSITGNGTLGITVKAAACTDGATNPNTASSAGATFTVDNTAPTITSISAPSVALTRGGPITYTVGFSESVSGFGPSGVQLNTTGTATGAIGITGSGPYTVTISSITGDGTLGITVKASACTDAAGNGNTASSASTAFTADNTAPTVTINQAGDQPDPTNGSPVNFTVTFSEPVSDFVTGDVTLGGTAGATTADISGGGTTYNVAVSGMTSEGSVTASLAAGVAHDAAGNASQASTSTDNEVAYDNDTPTATVGSPSASLTKAGPVTYEVSFGEAVTGFDSGDDIQVNATGTASAGTVSVSGSGTGPYMVTLSGITGDGTLGVTVKAGACKDSAGNLNAASSPSATLDVDNTAPTVTINQAGDQPDPTNGSPVNFTVAFSEPVSDFDGSDVALVGATNAVVTGSGTTYNVAVSGMASSGDVIASIAVGAAHDAAGNASAASTSTDNQVAYDNIAPTVAVTAPSGPTNSSTLNFTIAFSEPVIGLSADAVSVINGTKGALSGGGTAYTLTVIPAGQGDVTCRIPAAATKDPAGNDSEASNLASVTYDSLPPTATIGAPSKTLTKDGPVTYEVNFSEPVTGLSASGIELNSTGGATGSVATSGSGTGPYTVAVSGITGDGTLGIRVKAGVCADDAGNENTASASSATFEADNSAPYAQVLSAKQGTTELIGSTTDEANQGTVAIAFEATDRNLIGTPTITVTDALGNPITLGTLTDTGTGEYDVDATIDANTANGAATVTVTTEDSVGNSTTRSTQFDVNKSQLTVTLQLESVTTGSITRCITLKLGEPSGAHTYSTSQPVTFTNGMATMNLKSIPYDGAWTTLSAKDRFHTLRRTVNLFDPSGNQQFSANLTGNSKLLGGDLNDDNVVDIIDYAAYAYQYGLTLPAAGCDYTGWHADINGDTKVGTADYTYIQIRWLAQGDQDCPGAAGWPGMTTGRTWMWVSDMQAAGLTDAATMDQTHDNKVDTKDMSLYLKTKTKR